MGGQAEDKTRERICVGLLAHVDTGKTTLSKALLYLIDSIRKMGRVDNQDAFLDVYALERARGITILSKQAGIEWKGMSITLLDTPGHVDFSAEMERTLQVLDYTVLVISSSDGVQGHTAILWRLLSEYRVPTLIFVNKMDWPGTDRDSLLLEIRDRLDDGCVNFIQAGTMEYLKQVAMCGETVLEHFLETGNVEEEEIDRLICERKLFPCHFGLALRLKGVEEFLEGIRVYGKMSVHPDRFGAKVFKIIRDDQGGRLTHMKITGGSLKVKSLLSGGEEKGEEWQERVNQIRLYSGEKYEPVPEAEVGCIYVVAGLLWTFPGQGLGMEQASMEPLLESVLTHEVELPQGCGKAVMLPKLRELEEEDPQLHVAWDEHLQEIQAQLMGEVQIEVLKNLISERFGAEVEFGRLNIVYKKTIAGPVEGVGHPEPLRYYAEVHFLLESRERDSGLQFATGCSEDILDRNWQRLVMTRLEEKVYRGVPTGAPATDTRIMLVAGRAHIKHTEGGDPRQVTYRALRQGLMGADSLLLKPRYDFYLEIPEIAIGRAMADIEKRKGSCVTAYTEGGQARLTGNAPVSAMGDYQTEVTAYTKGCGHLTCTFRGYEPCHDQEEVMEASSCDPERGEDNPSGSVFYAHGVGFAVSWDHMKEYMHTDSGIFKENQGTGPEVSKGLAKNAPEGSGKEEIWSGTDEIDTILERTFYSSSRGKVRQKNGIPGKDVGRRTYNPPETRTYRPATVHPQPAEEYLLVDGYNIIYTWDELNSLTEDNTEGARGWLIDLLCNYQVVRGCNLILVFDAHRVKGHATEILDYHSIHVVYAKEAETADQYIEKFARENARRSDISVATSDGLEQVITLGQGCRRVSARGLWEDLGRVKGMLREKYLEKPRLKHNSLLEVLPEKAARKFEKLENREQE